MHDLAVRIRVLIADVKLRVPANGRNRYTQGYLDALYYVLEWVEDGEE